MHWKLSPHHPIDSESSSRCKTITRVVGGGGPAVPRFKAWGGPSRRFGIAKYQARLRMVMTYLFAQLFLGVEEGRDSYWFLAVGMSMKR